MTVFKTEIDSFGRVKIPSEALWGSSTQRALDNFPVSERRFPANFISALALIKMFSAQSNFELGLISKKASSAIVKAARAISQGEHLDQFPLDIFQTGSGTSTNMNMNEVIAHLASHTIDIHPNDHVNKGQSSNDIMPSALYVASADAIKRSLIPALETLRNSLKKKSYQFRRVLKTGRTHLMDATPITLGQEFSGWTRQIERCKGWIEEDLQSLFELAIGGTAVGTAINTHPLFAKKVCEKLSAHYSIKFVPAKNFFEAISSHGAALRVSGSLRTLAVSLTKIAEDIRLLASGPRNGLAEIELPALQPGSSIMPGKVNPVIPEMVVQVAAQVIANDMAVAMGCKGGHLELNTQLPLISSNLLESIEIISNACTILASKCIDGIAAHEDNCARNIQMSLALATALVPKIGYAKAAEVSREAHRTGRSVREAALSLLDISTEELNALLEKYGLPGK